ncbi:MAG: MFS transporter [Sciscionella sp.]
MTAAAAPATTAGTVLAGPALNTTARVPTRALLLTLCLANFMATLDVFVVNVALRDIGTHFGGGALSNVSWILNGYAIVFGALLIPAGRLADRFGRKGVFLAGVAVFTAASVGCAASPDLWTLVAFRCLQAAGAAVLVPSSLGLVLTSLPPERVTRSVRIWAITAAVAGGTGPVAGGLLTQLDWRAIFLINLPIGLATLASAARVVPVTTGNQATRLPGPVESLLIIVTVAALSLALVKGTDWGWSDPQITTAWLVALAAGAGFSAVNRRSTAPVVDLALFRSRTFTAANAAMALTAAAMATELLGLSLFLQQSWHWSPIATGASLAPAAVTTFAASQLGPRLLPRMRPSALAGLGCAIAASGQALLVITLHATHTHNYAGAILPGWLLVGIGGGLAIPTIIGTAIADLPVHAAGSGSAVVQMSRQIGSVLGTAILVASLGAAATTDHAAPFLHVWWATTGLWLTATATVIGKRTRSWHRRTPPPQRSAAKGSPATIAIVNPPL